MKIILLDDVAAVGRRGDVRDVSDGYARNFLIPKKLALSASAGNLKNLEHIKKRQASEEGKLFGSVTSQDIVDFLDKHGVKIERRRVHLDEPIKTLGEASVPIRVHADITAQLKVSVVRE
jgi:large subunit ribosomal protein L9